MNSAKEDFRLRVFLTLAREKSFSKTAAALGKTQPAISASLSELERIYGLKLINRDKSGNKLTEAGKVFREYAERVEGAYRDLARFCENVAGESDGGDLAGPQGNLAVETLRGLLPALRKMDLKLAGQIESLLDATE
ncbi:MAG: LysR family transcriptional regulator [Candidatus Cryptobacteroides sp.]|nr:LysR family transcriptional regulator [Candidatus Cryptobacteroides sp.]